MKKIIGLLAVLFITTGVFGQPSCCNFKQSTIEMTHRFQENGNDYAIGYDSKIERRILSTTTANPNDSITRSISLYRNDGGEWVKVSVNPIKTDFYKKIDGVVSYGWYKDNMPYYKGHGGDLNGLIPNLGYSSVEIKKNGIIDIRILNFCGVVGVDDDYNYRWDTYRLIPQKNKMYLATKITE